jgi:hypothetical protein
VKVLLYINDVTEEQGPTSVVRGSHRIPFGGVFSGPKGIFDLASAGFEGFAGGSSEHTAELGFAPLSSVPNHVKFAAKAGDCCIFDISSWRECSILHAFPPFDNVISDLAAVVAQIRHSQTHQPTGWSERTSSLLTVRPPQEPAGSESTSRNSWSWGGWMQGCKRCWG